MKLLLLPLLAFISFSPAHATAILACSTNGGSWTQSGCATPSMFNNFAATLDWGSPTAAGGFGAHPLEAGLGTAQNNTWDFSTQGNWMATASNGVNVGLGVGAGFAPANEILERTDNAALYFNPAKNGGSGWAGVAGPLDSYYNGYNVFAGHANSAPIQNPSSPPRRRFPDQFQQHRSVLHWPVFLEPRWP